MSDEKPPEYPTKQLPKPTQTEILLGELKAGQEIGFRQVNTNIDLVANEVRRAHVRIDELEGRITRHSGGVKELKDETVRQSEHDLSQDAELAKERAAREELAKKVDDLVSIGSRLDALRKDPRVVAIVGAISWLVYQYLKSKGAPLP